MMSFWYKNGTKTKKIIPEKRYPEIASQLDLKETNKLAEELQNEINKEIKEKIENEDVRGWREMQWEM